MSLRLISSDELLAEAGGTLDWVIYPLAVRGSSMMIYARQGVGKSSAMMQLAHSLITGVPWIGFEVRAQGPVIYLQIDMGEQETIKLVQRAEVAGYTMHGQLYVAHAEPGDESISFDILRDEDLSVLRDLCAQVQPIAVIVDTIHDSYEHQDKYKDVNALARRVHRRFKSAVGDAVLVFLNHERKSLPGRKKSDEAEDHDSFMGGQAWEGVVSASVQFTRERGRKGELRLKKVRLEEKPFERLELEIDKNGFFAPKRDHRSLLLVWPDCLPEKEREAAIAKLKCKADVFREIAAITGSKYETVRKHENDHPGVEYPWKKYVST
jgi:RecA-family ATPase